MRSNRALVFFIQLLLFIALLECVVAWASNSQRNKPTIVGGLNEQDASNPIYKDLAKKSLRQYMKEHGLTQYHEVIEVTKVTTQVVSGIMTNIEFNALLGSIPITCDSKILQKAWLNVENISVTCDFMDLEPKEEQKPGAPQDEDVNDPIYRQLAEESLDKYVDENGYTHISHGVVVVKKVTKQVVAGYITRILFDALLGSTQITCDSKIFEQAWLNVKDITVSCEHQEPRTEAPIPGGQVVEDVNDPTYINLALKSLEKYKNENGITLCNELIQVLKVTKQVVAGTKIVIDFVARLAYSSDIVCHSEIWQRPWLNKEEINVTCDNKS